MWSFCDTHMNRKALRDNGMDARIKSGHDEPDEVPERD
jgi:hypothetical protein